jgi:murein DD-endopeptidase MepM/ murein hydrolase activator NlpD
VVAIESGYVEALGWNQYGGWRIGIRSFDGQRYYYYAHLRKDHPFAADLYEGKIVRGGEVIGYLGMTGYSVKENVNNIKTPHLHVGLEVIFDPSQKDGYNQIWISMYELVNFLKGRRVYAYREGSESVSHICVIDENMPD